MWRAGWGNEGFKIKRKKDTKEQHINKLNFINDLDATSFKIKTCLRKKKKILNIKSKWRHKAVHFTSGHTFIYLTMHLYVHPCIHPSLVCFHAPLVSRSTQKGLLLIKKNMCIYTRHQHTLRLLESFIILKSYKRRIPSRTDLLYVLRKA